MKKAISVLLCFVMVIGVFCSTPMTVFAVETNPLSFCYNDDKTGWTVTLYNSEYDGDILIPAMVDDLPVLEIEDYAFDSGLNIKSITIPSTINKIGDDAFYGCHSLNKFIVDENNEYFCSIDGALYNKAATKLIAIPAGFTGGYVMPETVETATSGAFNNLQISSITINSKLTEFNESSLQMDTLMYSIYLTEINVSPDNPSYSSADGVLFNKDKTTLLLCPYGKIGDYTIPETVTLIAQKAFYRSNLTSITVGGNVKDILSRAFCGAQITNIKLEEGIEYIGADVFNTCLNLTSIKIPSNVKFLGSAFTECYNLKNVELGNNIVEIDSGLFNKTENLETLTLGNNYENISPYAFSGLTNVETLNLNSIEPWFSVELYPEYNIFSIADKIYIGGKDMSEMTTLEISQKIDFSKNPTIFHRFTSLNEFKIAENAENINYSVQDGVLYDLGKTTVIKYPTAKTGEYTFPESISGISSYAFEGSIGLTEITIPDTILNIHEYAFMNCSNLEKVKLPERITNIYTSTFYNCQNLTSINFPDSIENIYDDAFGNCKNLKTVKTGPNIVFVHSGAFTNCAIDDYYISTEIVTPRSVMGVKATTIHFEDGVKKIDDSAFDSNYNINSISFSDTVEEIGEEAFNRCINLKSIDFGSGLLKIGTNAFFECKTLNKVNLKNIHFWCNIRFSNKYSNPLFYSQKLYLDNELVEELEIPKGVIAIGTNAFSNCKSIKRIIIPSSVKSIGSYAFVGIEIEEIHIPSIEHWCNISLEGNDTIELIEDVTNVFIDGKKITNLVIPESVTEISDNTFKKWYFLESVSFNNKITRIGKSAFSCCINLKEITLPDSVKEIAPDAFSNCISVVTLDLGNNLETIGDYAFYGCSSLEKVIIPDSVKSIESYTFSYCTSLKEFSFGDGIEYINHGTLSNCTSLENLTIGKNVKYISGESLSNTALKELKLADLKTWCEMEITDSYFYPLAKVERFYVNDKLIEDELVIPDGVQKISKYAFNSYKPLKSVVISDSVTEIGEGAFGGCENLKKFTFGSGTKVLSTQIFYGNPSLTEIVFSEGIERIEENTLSSCTELKKITLPQSLKYFSCNNLETSSSKDIYYNSDLTDWMKIEFDGAYGSIFKNTNLYLNGELLETLVIPTEFTEIPDHVFSGIISIKTVEMHNKIERIGMYSFANCTGLKSISWSKGLTKIDDGAFRYCNSIEEISLPESLTIICDNAFSYCKNLKTVELPDSVSVIASDVFSNCKSLKNVRLPAKLTRINSRAFCNCSNLEIINLPETIETVGNFAFTGTSLRIVYGTPYSTAYLTAAEYNAQFIDTSTLFAAVGENKQENNNIITDGLMQSDVDDLVKTLDFFHKAKVIKSDNSKFIGTGSVIGIFDASGNLIHEVVVVVKGDLNGDGVCDTLDCMLADLARNSHTTLEDEYLTAADYTENKEIDFDDFQQIVNKAIGI